MRSLLDVMKVSAVGAILLSALAACNGKPESNPTPPSSDDGQLEVIIEQVVDGKVVDTRAVGRTDVVKYTGKTDGDDLIQISWPSDVSNAAPFDFSVYSKNSCYLKSINYRFDQESEYISMPIKDSTFGEKEGLKLIGKFQCDPSGSNKVYVNIDYKKLSKEDFRLYYGNNPRVVAPSPVPPGGAAKPSVYFFSDVFTTAGYIYVDPESNELISAFDSKKCVFTFDQSPYIKDIQMDDYGFRVKVVDPPVGETFTLNYSVTWVFDNPDLNFTVPYTVRKKIFL